MRLLRDRLAGETLKSETSKCGSPPSPRKASNLERKSATSKSNNDYENTKRKKSRYPNGKSALSYVNVLFEAVQVILLLYNEPVNLDPHKKP